MADVGERAYAAGLFDGEGCVQLYMRVSTMRSGRKNNALRTALSVSNTDLRPLYWLQERYGGRLSIDPRHTQKSDNHKRRPVARWIVFSDEADVFAQDIYPFVIIKREQLSIWMEARKIMYRRGYMPNGLSADEVDTRRDLVAQVKALKRVG